jgi:hypothetical protein
MPSNIIFLAVCGGFAATYRQKKKIFGGGKPPQTPTA